MQYIKDSTLRQKVRNKISALGIRNENYLLEAEKGVYKRIKNALTIIPATKESDIAERMRYLTPEENKRKQEMYRNMSEVIIPTTKEGE